MRVSKKTMIRCRVRFFNRQIENSLYLFVLDLQEDVYFHVCIFVVSKNCSVEFYESKISRNWLVQSLRKTFVLVIAKKLISPFDSTQLSNIMKNKKINNALHHKDESSGCFFFLIILIRR